MNDKKIRQRCEEHLVPSGTAAYRQKVAIIRKGALAITRRGDKTYAHFTLGNHRLSVQY